MEFKFSISILTFSQEIQPAALSEFQQPLFDSNQYASPAPNSTDEIVDGGELQATFVEYPSSAEMQYQQPVSQDYYATAAGFEQEQQAVPADYDYAPYSQSDSNYEQHTNYETTESLSNYNDSAAAYYDPNQTEIYDDRNYSNQQQPSEMEPSEYFYSQEQHQQQPYDDGTNAAAYLQDGNYYGNSEEFIETSNAAYTAAEDGTYGNVDVYQSQVPLENSNYNETQVGVLGTEIEIGLLPGNPVIVSQSKFYFFFLISRWNFDFEFSIFAYFTGRIFNRFFHIQVSKLFLGFLKIFPN